MDETLNFWFWLRQRAEIDEAALLARMSLWATHGAFDNHLAARDHQSCSEYLQISQTWRRQITEHQALGLRAIKPRQLRAEFRAMEAIGIELEVQWVLAPFGERWLYPPTLAILGVEGSTYKEQRAAIFAAAQSLKTSTDSSL